MFVQFDVVYLQGSVMIVFPEYGLSIPFLRSREKAMVFMEQVPDPDTDDLIPCLERPADPARILIQRTLSCIARNNSLYVVANMGSLETCDRATDSSCPDDGHYQFNTNVAYDPTGRLVARYRKHNLFVMETFVYDRPNSAERVYFDTPFGRVGTFVCFDVIFDEPAMSLAQRRNISYVTFSTAWMNKLPYYTAGPFHQSFAAATGVNMLAANLHWPSKCFCGSGIYGWDGIPRAFRCTNDNSSALLVADVTTNPGKAEDIPLLSITQLPRDLEGVPDFVGPVFKDPFNFVRLRLDTGISSVCHSTLCCWLNYTKAQNSEDQFALGAFRGLHTFEGQYYLEICLLMTCLNGSETHCGEGATTSTTFFTFFNLTGNFSTRYVYPQVVASGVEPTTDSWAYTRGVGTLVLPRPSTAPLLSATLYARRFDLDDGQVHRCSTDVGRTGHGDRYLFLAIVTGQCAICC